MNAAMIAVMGSWPPTVLADTPNVNRTVLTTVAGMFTCQGTDPHPKLIVSVIAGY